jgi:hypothetical protein
VNILPDVPHAGVGEIDVGPDLVEELLSRDLSCVIGLELEQEAGLGRVGAAEESLVLGRVEPPLRLELGTLHQRGRRVRPGSCPNLVRGDADAAALVFLLEKDLRYDLVERPVLEQADLIEAECTTLPLRLLPHQGLNARRPGCIEHLAAVDLRDDGVRGDSAACQQSGGIEEQEADDEEDHDDPPDVLGGAAHRLQHGGEILSG